MIKPPDRIMKMSCLAAAGLAILLLLINGVEFSAAHRDSPRGWATYAPPWTVPVLVTGLALAAVAAILGLSLALRKLLTRKRRP